jgi:hypothetical protein
VIVTPAPATRSRSSRSASHAPAILIWLSAMPRSACYIKE